MYYKWWLDIRGFIWIQDRILSEPYSTLIPHNLNVNEQNCALIDDEVVKRLNIGAIEESEHDEVNAFISNIFLVKKKERSIQYCK